jgi:hypothetical protein
MEAAQRETYAWRQLNARRQLSAGRMEHAVTTAPPYDRPSLTRGPASHQGTWDGWRARV